MNEKFPQKEETNQGESGGVNIKELLNKYLSYYWLFGLALATSFFLAWFYIRYTPPMYSVSSTLLLKDDDPRSKTQSGELFADLLLAQGTMNKLNEIEILKSRSLMIRVVKALGLQKEYRVIANVKTANTYGDLPFDLEIIQLKDSGSAFTITIETNDEYFLLKDNKTRIKYGAPFENKNGLFRLNKQNSFYHSSSYDEFEITWYPEMVAALKYAGNLQVKPADERSNVLAISYITENPKLGADILNQLMEEYNNSNIDDKNLINKKALAFIDDRLKIVEKQLDSVETNLQLFKKNKQVIDLTTQSEFFFDNLKTSLGQTDELEIQMNLIDILEEYLLNKKNNLQRVPSTLGLNEPTLLEITNTYNQLIIQREKQLFTGATPTSTVVTNLDASIEETRGKLVEALSNFKKAVRTSLQLLYTKSEAYQSEIKQIPEKERESREKMRQQQIKQNLYLYLLQKKEESSLSQASTIASSKVVDNASSMADRVSPKVLNIYSIALLIGFLIPLATIYFIDLFNDKITTKSDIQKYTSIPIVAEIGHNSNENTLVFEKNDRSIVAEQFRMLRSNLKYLLNENKSSHVVLVTSSISGEGKSFVSTNLAASLAIMGRKTVILEFDLRKPKIMSGLKLSATSGLTNFLVGDASLEMLPTEVPNVKNLTVISSGPIPPNPSELLLSKKIDDLFSFLKQRFDYIVVDTAPVGLVSDAFTLSLQADACLYIVRQGYTLKRQVNPIDELYKNKKLPPMGLLVNDIHLKGRYRGYYGYGSYYGYGYSGEYFEGEKKRSSRKK